MSSEDGWGGEHLTWTQTWSPDPDPARRPQQQCWAPSPRSGPPQPPHAAPCTGGCPSGGLQRCFWQQGGVWWWGLLASASSLPVPQAPVGPPYPGPLPQTPPTHSRYPRPLGRPVWGQQPGRGVIAAPWPSSESRPQGVSWGSRSVGCAGAGVPAPPGERAPPRGPPKLAWPHSAPCSVLPTGTGQGSCVTGKPRTGLAQAASGSKDQNPLRTGAAWLGVPTLGPGAAEWSGWPGASPHRRPGAST